MEIAVREAAERLGVSPARIRQLLTAGDLTGRQVGREWLVSASDIARLQGQRRRPGRPLGPKRSWGLIDLLSGGSAPWLSYSARSQVRSYMLTLDDADADEWRSILRSRSRIVRAVAHPAALPRLRSRSGVLAAGVDEAKRRGFDLVAVGDQVVEVYVADDLWQEAQAALALRAATPDEDANLVVRLPHKIWPFAADQGVPDAALAADLLESAEPRAVRAGELRLSELLARWQRA